MKCLQARRMFGAYWDDETTQAEREWLESHLAACAPCRTEYEALSRSLELAGSLPRVEPAPDLVERVLASARRAAPARDRLPDAGRPWVPATAALALLVIAFTTVVPWLGGRSPERRDGPAMGVAVREPVLVPPAAPVPARSDRAPVPRRWPDLSATGPVAGLPDSLFDHSEDVEFILDPVTLHRGRASVSRPSGVVRGEKAVISF